MGDWDEKVSSDFRDSTRRGAGRPWGGSSGGRERIYSEKAGVTENPISKAKASGWETGSTFCMRRRTVFACRAGTGPFARNTVEARHARIKPSDSLERFLQ